MIFMDSVKKIIKKTLQCRGALKFQGKNLFLNKMKINKFLKKKRTKSKKMNILIILYPKLYQSMKNHSKN